MRLLGDGGGDKLESVVTTFGPPEAADAVARALKGLAHDIRVETVSSRSGATTFRIGHAREVAREIGLRPALAILEEFRGDVFLDPLVHQAGRARATLVAPPGRSTRDVLVAAQSACERAGHGSFRVLKVEPEPLRAFGSRDDMLEADDEALLRVAHAFGYYATPKTAKLETIARHVGLTTSPLHKRLVAAERAIVEAWVASPAAPPPSRARARAGQGTSVEVHARIEACGDALGAATRDHPDVRVVLHPLGEAGGVMSSRILVEGTPEARAAFFEAWKPGGAERVAESPRHAMLTIRAAEPDDHARCAAAFGAESFARPSVLMGGVLTLRLVLIEPTGRADLEARLAEGAAHLASSRTRLLGLRAGTLDLPPLAGAWDEPMTTRQEQVLRVAHALGYYRTPRATTLARVAATLGISTNAAHKSLVAAELKLVTRHLASPD
ncbi:MAG TPA: helix-turn-helix domain-containing protein [Candidatus Thermoplasmatota archaeon]|nr:helix-turn-helix domain-containing protein [Candidatus Thermoplasmatota archaeon]